MRHAVHPREGEKHHLAELMRDHPDFGFALLNEVLEQKRARRKKRKCYGLGAA